MAKCYTKFLAQKLLTLCFWTIPLWASANATGGPEQDSLARLGHCKTVVKIDTLCATHEIRLSSFVLWTFTGLLDPVIGTWNNGQVAHRITVVPPGTWSWDPTGTTCEPYHWGNEVSFDLPFFDGPIEISGPTALCPNDGPGELTLNLNGYSNFANIEWTPPNPTGDIDPYPVFDGGTYSINTTDAFNCKSSDQISIVKVPAFTPVITGPNRMCPEGDTAVLSITNPAQYNAFEWSNGDVTSPISVNEPGSYMVTATDTHGCTGVGTFGIQSGGVDPFAISVSSPVLCPGQLDTLRVVGGYSSYVWSNNVTGITNIVNQAGTYTVTVTNINGCTGTSSASVAPLLPPVIQVLNTPLCPGDSATLTTFGGNFPQYEWSSGQTTKNIIATMPGTYSVTVSGNGVCTTSTSTVLNFAPAPTTAVAAPDTLSCKLPQITLDGSGSSSGANYHLTWTTPDGHFVADDNTLNPVVDAAGTYILSIVNTGSGCIINDTVLVARDVAAPPADAGLPSSLTCSIQDFAIGPLPAPTDPDLLPSWSTPNGNILSGNDTWAPSVNQPGNYIVTVTNATNGCTSTAEVIIDQDIALPNAQIAAPNLITCTQGIVVLDGSESSSGPGFNYLWTTANGILSGSANTPISTASSIGTYQLLVTNSLNGCTSTATVTVAADLNIPVVGAMPVDTLNCSVGTAVIDATPSSSGPTFLYNWTTSNGNIVNGVNTLTPTVAGPGVYTLSLLNTANNCSATLAVTVLQDIAPPVANAGPTATLSCNVPFMSLDGSASSAGPGFIYQWNTGNGHFISGVDALNPSIDMAGDYQLLVTNLANGCTATASVSIMNDATAPVAAIEPPAVLTCTTQQTILDASASSQTGNLSIVWTGNISSGQGTVLPGVDQPGVYTLTITNNTNGCTDVASVTVLQDITAPNAEAGPDGLINCFSPATVIGNVNNPSGPVFSAQWTTTDGQFVSLINGPTALVDQPGTYQVLITNTQNGCTATDVVTVAADFAAPSANAGPTNELTCVQTSLALQGSGSTGPLFNYLWTSSDGNIITGATTLTPTINEPGLYNLLVTNTQNGCTAANSVTITENANGPVAAVGIPQTLTCTLASTTISATGSSTGPVFTYAWSTGNGNISAGANTFSATVDAPGVYIVTVTNTGNLCTQTASATVLENVQPPLINAGLDNVLTCTTTSLPLQAQIVSASSNNIAYLWSTTNGHFVSGSNTANPLIDAPGVYVVQSTDLSNGCTSTDQLEITEDVTLPIAVIADPQTLTCAIQQVTLNASTSSTGNNFIYNWTTPTGHFVTQQNPQQPVVDVPGVYQLLITNNINGCTQTASATVPQNIQLPAVEAGTAAGLDCDTPTNTLNGTASVQGAGYTYTWSTVNGQIISGANTLTPVIGDPGNYILSILNTQNGCSNTDFVLVTEDVQHPVLAIAPPQILTCNILSVPLNGSGSGFGNAPAIAWSTSNGHLLNGSSTLTAMVDEPGVYTLTVQNTNNGCTASIPVTVLENIQAPPVQVQPAPLLTCSVLQLPLQSTAPAQALMSWSTSNGHIVGGANSPNPTVDQPGIYVLTVTASNGCTNTAQVEVQRELNIPTGLTFNLHPPLCNGTPGLLTVDDVDGGVRPFTYSINGGQTFFSADAFNNLAPGNYDLVIQDANGCEVAETVEVPSPPVPFVTVLPLFELALGETQVIQALVPPPFPLALVDTVIWAPMTGLTFAGNTVQQLLQPLAQPFKSTDYSVTIVTQEGCKSIARTRILVDRQLDIYVPNVIWPEDPDGNNSIFEVFAREASITKINKLQIFDRWGSLMFENRDFLPNDASEGWNGEYKGLPVNPAVFVWWLEVELVDGRTELLKGDVTVVR